jgi:tetratricopeptide (TPR) repeat protein
MTRLAAAPLVVVLAVAAVTTAAPRAYAAAPAADDAGMKRAQGRFKKGEKLFALGRFSDALAEYQAAFEAYPLPEFLFNIGQCHRNLGAFDEAIFSFRKYLRLKPDAENREATEELIAELEAEKARQASKPVKPRVDPIPGGGGGAEPAEKSSPFYTRWWFWTGVVVVAGAATTAIVLANQEDGLPTGDLPPIDFPR